MVGAAIIFADVDDQSVKFVKDRLIGGESRLKQFTDFVVGQLGANEAVAFEDATSVGVDHKYGMFAGVEKNAVSGLRSDAAQVEKLLAQNQCGSFAEPRERTGVGSVKEFHKGL